MLGSVVLVCIFAGLVWVYCYSVVCADVCFEAYFVVGLIVVWLVVWFRADLGCVFEMLLVCLVCGDCLDL